MSKYMNNSNCKVFTSFQRRSYIGNESHELSEIYNDEIDESQAGFLHRKGTISAPTVCAVRSRLTPSGPGKTGAMWFRDEVPVSNGFDTYFTFQISDHSKECTLHKDQYFTQQSFRTCSVHGGDGFAFIPGSGLLGNIFIHGLSNCLFIFSL